MVVITLDDSNALRQLGQQLFSAPKKPSAICPAIWEFWQKMLPWIPSSRRTTKTQMPSPKHWKLHKNNHQGNQAHAQFPPPTSHHRFICSCATATEHYYLTSHHHNQNRSQTRNNQLADPSQDLGQDEFAVVQANIEFVHDHHLYRISFWSFWEMVPR